MKKLKFNSTINHKQSDYQTYEVEIEKVVISLMKLFIQ